MKKILLSFFFALFLLQPSFAAKGRLFVVTTTTDLADLTRAVGGDAVEAVSLSRGDQMGCHSVEPRPSMVVNLRKADALIRIGMDYDSWADSLIDAARNPRIVYGASGYIDTSAGIERMEVPEGKVDASMGHIHLYGNPHYWLDPRNAEVITKNIAEGLSRAMPERCGYFETNREAYLARLDAAMRGWAKKMEPYRGKDIVTYHKSWEYFARRFGLHIVATVEPKPGIPPSAAHLNALVRELEGREGLMLFHENVYPKNASRMLAEWTGARLLVLPVSTGGLGGRIKDYIGLFDYIVASVTGETP